MEILTYTTAYACLIFAKKTDLLFLAKEFNKLSKRTKEPKLRIFYSKQSGRYKKELESRGYNWKNGCQL